MYLSCAVQTPSICTTLGATHHAAGRPAVATLVPGTTLLLITGVVHDLGLVLVVAGQLL